METKLALVGIIIEESEAVEAVNELLHEYRDFIVGRMGIPYREKNVNIISVVLDAADDKISALSGKLGKVPGTSVKCVQAKTRKKQEEGRN